MSDDDAPTPLDATPSKAPLMSSLNERGEPSGDWYELVIGAPGEKMTRRDVTNPTVKEGIWAVTKSIELLVGSRKDWPDVPPDVQRYLDGLRAALYTLMQASYLAAKHPEQWTGDPNQAVRDPFDCDPEDDRPHW